MGRIEELQSGLPPPINSEKDEGWRSRAAAIRAWQRNPKQYTEAIQNPDSSGARLREAVLYPALFNVIGDVGDKKVLDAGCGPGVVACMLQGQGADIYGVDVVQDFLDQTQRSWLACNYPDNGKTTSSKRKEAKRRFKYSDLTERIRFSRETFDVVVSNLVLMWVPDIKKPAQEFLRVLKPGGKAVIAILHPSTSLAYIDRRNPKNPISILDKSPLNGVHNRMISHVCGPFPFFQRSISEYQRTFQDAGFIVRAGIEPLAPVDFQDYARQLFPEFMIFEFQKPAEALSVQNNGETVYSFPRTNQPTKTT